MKIGIFQDVHANLPAFEKGLEVFEKYNCQKIYHVGDLIGIGPHPKEVFELALATKELEFIMGNHDYWFAFGIPNPQPKYMSDEEVAHQKWTHNQIGEKFRATVQSWKYKIDLDLGHSQKASFIHYGYDEKLNWFKTFVKKPDPENLKGLFEGLESDIIFYGHNHTASDIQGSSRYVNLGSTGCYNKPEARLGILSVNEKGTELEKLSIEYDDRSLMEDFEKRQVPARDFIKKTFITRS